LGLAEYLGIRPRLTNNNRVGGSSFQTYVLWAALALATGQCDVALIAYGSNQRSASGKLQSSLKPSPFEAPYQALVPASAYALAAARHMHQFGTTREQLAQVAVAARQWAQLNPEAFVREPLSVQQCLAARMLSAPLTVRDSCLVTDGAAALVMTRGDRARELCLHPVYVLGAAEATQHRMISTMPD
jgi:acetyl-CoA acetyltransferase